ncbi:MULTISPECIES: effector-associated constant component EACC1 [unclassified Streptomyces]|uniref:effector-associated constant component EACC1 n=1 Tax=unclassified Streptomyces TaxID=2593676 RepID=UPI002E14A4C5|nr:MULTISPECIES: hypothetical protein [unclassified Streptomyces]WSR25091.1 hypothetical protein OG573_02395 [Streptomyces sp. NBC_01205]
MNEFELRVGRDGDPEAELRSLLAWLSEDETVGRAVRGRIRGELPAGNGDPDGGGSDLVRPQDGHMNAGGFDVLQLAVESGLSTVSLVFTVLQWRLARRRPPGLTLRRGPYEVRIDGSQAADPESVRRIVAALDGDDDGSS